MTSFENSSAPSALLFGGAGAIAMATAQRLIAAGWHVTLAGRTEQTLQEAARRLGENVTIVVADATLPSEVNAAVDQATAFGHGRLDGVLHAVGSILLKPAHVTTDSDWEQTLTLNLTSAFYVLRAVVRVMSRAHGGSIVLLGSAAGRLGLANHEAIAAAKAGVVGLARAAAATYAVQGVRVNVVSPGLVDTPLAKNLLANERSRKVSEAMHPLGRIGTANDVGAAAAYLLSKDAAWVTGQELSVDGGLASLKLPPRVGLKMALSCAYDVTTPGRRSRLRFHLRSFASRRTTERIGLRYH